MLKIYCKNKQATSEWVVCEATEKGAVAFKPVADLNVPALLNVMNFLCWYQESEPNAMWGGVRVGEAVMSMQTLLDMPDHIFKDIRNVALRRFDEVASLKEH